MDQKLVALVVIGVVAFVTGGSEAISCYSCDSLSSNSCLDPFSTSGATTCNGSACTKIIASALGVTVVTRGCLPVALTSDGCLEESVAGVGDGTICQCSSNLCNDGGTLKPMYKITFAAVMATIVAVIWVNKT